MFGLSKVERMLREIDRADRRAAVLPLFLLLMMVGELIGNLWYLASKPTDPEPPSPVCRYGAYGQCWCREPGALAWAPWYVCSEPSDRCPDDGVRCEDQSHYPDGDPTRHR